MTEDGEKRTPEEEEPKHKSDRLWTPYSDPRAPQEEKDRPEPSSTGEEEISEEELRKRIEEAMEKITVADVVVDMMVSLSSLAYQRMGIPKEINEKYRDMDQAKMAIDCLDAMLEVLEPSLESERLQPLRGTVDNLKLNFAKES